ncbi:MAG: hypothetical protein J6Q11_00650 [Fibrobacteraceae bacterium]|nr:hypothetical protein [Fibrobacteraceae bacterium]
MITFFLITLGILTLFGCGGIDEACCITLFIKILLPVIGFVLLFLFFIII